MMMLFVNAMTEMMLEALGLGGAELGNVSKTLEGLMTELSNFMWTVHVSITDILLIPIFGEGRSLHTIASNFMVNNVNWFVFVAVCMLIAYFVPTEKLYLKGLAFLGAYLFLPAVITMIFFAMLGMVFIGFFSGSSSGYDLKCFMAEDARYRAEEKKRREFNESIRRQMGDHF